MGLGILEDRHLDPVPGTATLDDRFGGAGDIQHFRGTIKRSKDGVILVPQPTDDPDDPLNWPLWQRDLAVFVLCAMTTIASTLSPLLAANTVYLINYFGGLSPTDAALLTGYHVLGVAMSGFVFVASARIWGKRHLFLLGPIIMIVSTIWGASSGHNYKSLVAARVFQGVGLAPFEGLVNAAVGELYFVHESGKRLALANMCLFGAAFFTPVLVGKITLSLDWQWSFWFVAIFMGALYPFVVLYVPETAFNRDAYHRAQGQVPESISQGTSETDLSSQKTRLDSVTTDVGTEKAPNPHIGQIEAGTTTASPASSHEHRSITWEPVQRKLITRKSLAIFNGRKTDESFWKVCIRPFPLFLQPAILWACVAQGAMIAWVTFVGVSLALSLLSLGFNEAQTGYMYTGPFVGALIGFTLAGVVSDTFARWLSKLNKGIFEPEFRLILIIPALLIGVPGLFAYGVVANDLKHYGWLPLDVFFGFLTFALTVGTICCAQYIADGYRHIMIEGFTDLMIFKNLFVYVCTYKGFGWLLKGGVKDTVFIFGYVQVAIYGSAILIWIFGKRLRSFCWRYDILKALRLY